MEVADVSETQALTPVARFASFTAARRDTFVASEKR
jgi:hypothetical protein